MFYTGDKFLFKNKYNFISFDQYESIGFYSLMNTEGKNEIEILKKDIGMSGEKNNGFIKYDELVYYTLSDSSFFTSNELQNEGKILIPIYSGYYFYKEVRCFSFLEISIKTLEITKIIDHFQNSEEPSEENYIFLRNKESCSLSIYRNRFASFIYTLNKVQKYLIFDLKNIKNYQPSKTKEGKIYNETM